MKRFQKLCQGLLMLISLTGAKAQQAWPSPEVEQMYRHANEYMAMGNFADAIVNYKHAISLAPGKMILYRDLANALYLSGKYNEAEQALASLHDMPDADAQCYRILAASRAAQKNYKGAKATLKNGLGKFPSSGLLYHEKGVVYEQEQKHEDALSAWLDGIQHDPEYTLNYYDAAQVYFRSNHVIWGLLYGEIFLNISQDTTGAQELKNKLFAGYKTMFDNVAKDIPEYGKIRANDNAGNFADAVLQTCAGLTPVVSDGITTENLTMVRTRFLMDWFSRYSSKYPFSLFSYLDELVRTGHFDIYNEWLFGKAEGVEEYTAWNKFHEGDLDRFSAWQKTHHLSPSSQDFYNNRKISGLFIIYNK